MYLHIDSVSSKMILVKETQKQNSTKSIAALIIFLLLILRVLLYFKGFAF